MALAVRMIAYEGVAFDSPKAQRLFAGFHVFVQNVAGRLHGDKSLAPQGWPYRPDRYVHGEPVDRLQSGSTTTATDRWVDRLLTA